MLLMHSKKIIFYYRDSTNSDISDCFDKKKSSNFEVWLPSLLSLYPKGFDFFPYVIWWLFYYLKIFKNRIYLICVLQVNGQIIHRSCVFPPFFRFPFMKSGDLQIGDVWTSEGFRGHGYASEALGFIFKKYSGHGFWFLCASDNHASAKIAMNNGMRVFGTGQRKSKWFGFLPSSYIINDFN